MPRKSDAALFAQINIIKNEKGVKANTATRVGTTLEDLAHSKVNWEDLPEFTGGGDGSSFPAITSLATIDTYSESYLSAEKNGWTQVVLENGEERQYIYNRNSAQIADGESIIAAAIGRFILSAGGPGNEIIQVQPGILIRWPISAGVTIAGTHTVTGAPTTHIQFNVANAVVLRGPSGPLPALNASPILEARLDIIPVQQADNEYRIDDATKATVLTDGETLSEYDFFYLNLPETDGTSVTPADASFNIAPEFEPVISTKRNILLTYKFNVSAIVLNGLSAMGVQVNGGTVRAHTNLTQINSDILATSTPIKLSMTATTFVGGVEEGLANLTCTKI